jgi:hypothetical protein
VFAHDALPMMNDLHVNETKTIKAREIGIFELINRMPLAKKQFACE